MAFIGEIRIYAGVRIPDGWMACDGATLPISGNEALFSLIGTTYGGDGVTTFNLPNLQARIPIHMGQGQGLSPRSLGQSGGVTNVTLTANNLPSHTHQLSGSTAAPASPNGGVLAAALTYGSYNASTMVALAPQSVQVVPPGGTQPHTNEQPALRLTFIIAMTGIYPSRS